MPRQLLQPAGYESFVKRFHNFHDAVFRKIEVSWISLHRRCIIEAEALDTQRLSSKSLLSEQLSSPSVWARVTIWIDDMQGMCCPSDWTGVVYDLALFDYGESFVLAVDSWQTTKPVAARGFYDMARPLFFVEGRRLSYDVISPFPWAERLAEGRLKFKTQARVKNAAPPEYRPGSLVTLWKSRVIEEDEASTLPVGTLVYAAQYPDRLMEEVPEEWLEQVSSS